MKHVTGATLLVATRKGLFTWQREDAVWRLKSSAPDFPGEPVSMVLRDPRDGTDYAALNLGHFGVKLWCRERDASEWTELSPPAFAPQIEQSEASANDAQAPSVSLLWSLEAAGPDAPGVLWAGTIPVASSAPTTEAAPGHWCKACGIAPSAPNGWGAGTITPAFIRSVSIRATADR